MPDTPSPQPRKMLGVGLAAFAVLSAILIAAYFALFAKDYAVLYENLRESDTSAVTAELDKQGIAYRLKDDGHSVLVDKGDIASARVAVAAANILAGGEVGLELFNDADIGLSEFSQKMNYLRALQGELTRTIMAMDGIRFTRVHLALPERSIFRDEQTRATAAITIQTVDGQPLAPNQVVGLQQLVAASVTGLSPDEVVVLDANGTALSPPPGGDTDRAELTERAAYEQYSRVRARTAIDDLMGVQAYDIMVSARDLPAPASPTDTDAADDGGSGKTGGGLAIVVRTANDIDVSRQNQIRSRLAEHLVLDLGGGDSIEFRTGVVAARPASSRQPSGNPVNTHPVWDRSTKSPRPGADVTDAILTSRWLWFALAVAGTIFWLIWRQRGALSDAERDHFAAILADEIESHRREVHG